MKWLIVEDALKNRWGHWLEYDANFLTGLRALGEPVRVLCDRTAEADVAGPLDAQPVLPRSIWHRMSDKAGALTRYARVPGHGLATFHFLRRYFSKFPDLVPTGTGESAGGGALIFVPTVLVHHLLGWYLLLKSGSVPVDARVLLFFPNLPLQMDPGETAHWNGSPTTRLMAWLFEQLRPWVEQRKVVLGTETEAMQQSLAQLIGMPVAYLPHPIEPLATKQRPRPRAEGEPLLFACYGTARAEKGSDVLQTAIGQWVSNEPPGSEPPVAFAIQWIDDFTTDDGRKITVDPSISESGKVDYIRRFFRDNEYEEHLQRTDVMLLPYVAKSYNVRVSRIVIEAMVHGIPVIASEGTTVWSQALEFGAGKSVPEGDPQALVAAMRHIAGQFDAYARQADATAARARSHFSIQTFRRLLQEYLAADCLVAGDSHVARWNWAALGANVWSYGVAGITSAGLLDRINRWQVAPPASLILWIGTNDLLQGSGVSTVIDNVRGILARFPKAVASKQVALVELPPLASHATQVGELNTRLQALAAELSLAWVPISGCVTRDGVLRPGLTPDGVHLNPAGYQALAPAIHRTCGTWLAPANRDGLPPLTAEPEPLAS